MGNPKKSKKKVSQGFGSKAGRASMAPVDLQKYAGVMAGELIPIHGEYFHVERIQSHWNEVPTVTLTHYPGHKLHDWEGTGIDEYAKALEDRVDILPKIREAIAWEVRLFRQAFRTHADRILSKNTLPDADWYPSRY